MLGCIWTFDENSRFILEQNLHEPCSGQRGLNSLPNNKILDCSKFKAFADDKINVGQKLKTVYGRVENIVGKGENVLLIGGR